MSNEQQGQSQISNETLEERIFFVPSDLFWTKKLVTAEVMKKQDLEEFCATNLEGMSPFNVEQLMWGKVVHGKEVLLYVTIKDRIESLFGNLEDFLYVLPGFLTFNLQRPKANANTNASTQARFVQSNRSLSLLFWGKSEANSGMVLPDDICSVSLSELPDEAEIKSKKEELFQMAVRKGISLDNRDIACRMLQSSHLSLSKEALFVIQSMTDGTVATEILSKDKHVSLWEADIRDKAFIKKLKNGIRRKGICWKLFLAALLMLFFLLGGNVLKIFAQWGLESSNKKFSTQVPLVAELESKDFLIKKFERMLYQARKPLETLTILNDIRPDNIYFSSVNLDSNLHSVVVEGVAENSTAISAYSEALNGNAAIQSHQFTNLHVSSQGTQFTLSCIFKDKIQVHPQQAVVAPAAKQLPVPTPKEAQKSKEPVKK